MKVFMRKGLFYSVGDDGLEFSREMSIAARRLVENDKEGKFSSQERTVFLKGMPKRTVTAAINRARKEREKNELGQDETDRQLEKWFRDNGFKCVFCSERDGYE
jgi:hypothetical protein